MNFFKLIVIGIAAGGVLAGMMQIIYLLTGNKAYILLYNTDYIPVLKHFEQSAVFGFVFHFLFCIASVVILFYLLKWREMEYRLLPYILIYTGGSAILFFLSAFTDKPPEATDRMAWIYWTLSHLFYSICVSVLIKYWIAKTPTANKKSATG